MRYGPPGFPTATICSKETIMSSTPAAGLTPTECLSLLAENRRRWLAPTVVCAVLAAGYAWVMPRYWEASQALVVRKQAIGSAPAQPGEFADLYEMRTFQETILELAKSRQVLTATLKSVAPQESATTPSEPTEQAIESFRRRLSMLPPKGAEFGKTEVFYFHVKDKNRDRAVRLVAELCRQLDIRLRRLREAQAQSLISELEQQVDLAKATHEVDTQHLVEFETQVGADLGELRMLHSAFSGQSDLRQESVELENESRRTEARVREAEQLLAALRAAQKDPQQLIAMPSSLLTSQPTLRRLKDGLVDAQLRAARLNGSLTVNHPHVQAAFDSVEHIRRDLHRELQVAIQGIEIELSLSRERAAIAKQQYHDVQQRLRRLAEQRVEYSNRVSTAKNSQVVLDQASAQLSEVRAMQAAAGSANLVMPVDQPEVGTHPVGPGRTIIVAAGTLGGFILGLGWVFLTAAGPSVPTSRASEPASPTLAVGIRPQPRREKDSMPDSPAWSKVYEPTVVPDVEISALSSSETIGAGLPVGASLP